MKIRIATWCAAALVCLLRTQAQAQAQVEAFEIDPDHSGIDFTIRFMGITNIHGAFSEFGGTLIYADDVTRSSITAVVKTESINTNSTPRDKHLRTADFFDAAKFPLIVFQSKRIMKSVTGFTALGTLTMHGVTKDVSIPFTQVHPRMQDAWKNTRVGFLGELKVNRKDYGINGTAFWNSEFDPGRMVVGDTATITLSVQGIIPNYELWQTPGADTLIAHIRRDGAGPALTELKQRADTNPASAQNTPRILRYSAHKLLQRKQNADALHVAQMLVQVAPQSADAFTLLGEAYLANGKRGEAVQSFQSALKLDAFETGALERLRALNVSWLDNK